jgi:hypothetical protein
VGWGHRGILNYQRILTILAAYAGGVMTAAFFLSGPVSQYDTRGSRSIGRPRLTATTTLPPTRSPAPSLAPSAPSQHDSMPSQRPVRVIPIDRRANLETTGAAPAESRQVDNEPRRSAVEEAKCDYRACGRAYQSFDPATCTYQPYHGPRRQCEK